MAKKLILVIVCLAIVFSVATLIFAQKKDFLRISKIEGDVLVLRQGQRNWESAMVGMELEKGDSIRTGVTSSAFLTLNGDFKNTIQIKESSEAMIESLNPVKIYMGMGEILSKIDDLKKGSTFEIRTPTAVAGVAGTGFKTSYDAKTKRFEVAVHKGKVKVLVPEELTMKNTKGMAFAEGYKEYEIPADVKAILDEAGLTQKALDALDKQEWEQFINEVRDLIRQFEESGGTDKGALFDAVEEKLEDADKNRDDRFEMEDMEKIEERLKPQEQIIETGTPS